MRNIKEYLRITANIKMFLSLHESNKKKQKIKQHQNYYKSQIIAKIFKKKLYIGLRETYKCSKGTLRISM